MPNSKNLRFGVVANGPLVIAKRDFWKSAFPTPVGGCEMKLSMAELFLKYRNRNRAIWTSFAQKVMP